MDESIASDEHLTSQELWDRLVTLGPENRDDGDDARFELVAELDRLGEPEPVTWALKGLQSPVAWHRTAAAWVLGEHGFNENYPYRRTAAAALTAAARAEADDDARATMVRSLSRAGSADDATAVVAFGRDPSADVRFEVAAGIPGVFDGEEIAPAVVDMLIELTGDDDSDVRDWATFSLGTQSDLDSTAIRAALAARLDDSGDGGPDDGLAIREEALIGLARRQGPASVRPAGRVTDWPGRRGHRPRHRGGAGPRRCPPPARARGPKTSGRAVHETGRPLGPGACLTSVPRGLLRNARRRRRRPPVPSHVVREPPT